MKMSSGVERRKTSFDLDRSTRRRLSCCNNPAEFFHKWPPKSRKHLLRPCKWAEQRRLCSSLDSNLKFEKKEIFFRRTKFSVGPTCSFFCIWKTHRFQDCNWRKLVKLSARRRFRPKFEKLFVREERDEGPARFLRESNCFRPNLSTFEKRSSDKDFCWPISERFVFSVESKNMKKKKQKPNLVSGATEIGPKFAAQTFGNSLKN